MASSVAIGAGSGESPEIPWYVWTSALAVTATSVGL